MTAESSSDGKLEIGHVLFMDVVGYSKLLLDEQRELQQQLTEVVRNTEQVRAAEAARKLSNAHRAVGREVLDDCQLAEPQRSTGQRAPRSNMRFIGAVLGCGPLRKQ